MYMKIALAGLCLLTVASCSVSDGQSAAPAALDVGRWTLVEVDGVAAEPGGWLEISLADGQVAGSTGCNDFRLQFKGSPEAMTSGPIGSTKKMCMDPLMAQERRVYEILEAATRMEVDDGGKLKVSGTRGYLRADLDAP
ncbi:MAG: META domain-containing protein [Xanthomonadales bacterium]|nr:META domain-containing protein [Xanthomonadales bacterium]